MSNPLLMVPYPTSLEGCRFLSVPSRVGVNSVSWHGLASRGVNIVWIFFWILRQWELSRTHYVAKAILELLIILVLQTPNTRMTEAIGHSQISYSFCLGVGMDPGPRHARQALYLELHHPQPRLRTPLCLPFITLSLLITPPESFLFPFLSPLF